MTKVDIFEKVSRIVADHKRIDIENVVPETQCADMDKFEIVKAVEMSIGICLPAHSVSEIKTVEDLTNSIINYMED